MSARLHGHHLERMKAQLVLHEGLRLKRYKCTSGKWTLGVGYNYEDRGLAALERALGRKVDPVVGITRTEAMVALDADIERYEDAVVKHFPAYLNLDPIRQRVALDMAFNMGYRALGFKHTMRFIAARDWINAHLNMLKSLWAKQVGDGPGGKWDRGERLSRMMLTGEEYTK